MSTCFTDLHSVGAQSDKKDIEQRFCFKLNETIEILVKEAVKRFLIKDGCESFIISVGIASIICC